MMTYCPLNARSELMSLVNCPWGGVLETRRRFQVADPASNSPGFKPTLGSGFGATVDNLAPPAHARDERAIAAANEDKRTGRNTRGLHPDAIKSTISMTVKKLSLRHSMTGGERTRACGLKVRALVSDFRDYSGNQVR